MCSISMCNYRVYVNTCTCVSPCVCDNSAAGGIRSPPTPPVSPCEIKALGTAQDVGSEVIHTHTHTHAEARAACQRGLSAHLHLQQPEHTVHFHRNHSDNRCSGSVKAFLRWCVSVCDDDQITWNYDSRGSVSFISCLSQFF